jgi:hypothetical protein
MRIQRDHLGPTCSCMKAYRHASVSVHHKAHHLITACCG